MVPGGRNRLAGSSKRGLATKGCYGSVWLKTRAAADPRLCAWETHPAPETGAVQERTEPHKKQNKSGLGEQVTSLGFMYAAVLANKLKNHGEPCSSLSTRYRRGAL